MAYSSSSRSRNASPMRSRYVTSFKPSHLEIDDDLHPVIHAGRVALITGGASGIGRAAAIEFAKLGLKIAIADVDEVQMKEVEQTLSEIVGKTNVLIVPTDVSKIEEVIRLKERVYEQWGEVGVLMNNAGVGTKSTSWAGLDDWHKVFNVNLFGVVNIQHTFVSAMLHQENPSIVITTGSKQGITNPPGNPAYNASKAAVKSLTEALAYELRDRSESNVTAHLFIPGWTFTGMTGAAESTNKPAGAWSAQETVGFMLDKVRQGDFYILVPDNETKHEVDQLRIMWAAADVAEGRPALSRWHSNWKGLFEEYMKEGMAQLQGD